MEIDYLATHPDAVPRLAAWFHQEWSHLYPDRTLEDVERTLGEHANTDHIPLALVAVEGGQVIGTVALTEHDMDMHRELSPWLASLYVTREWRRRGIGSALVRAMESKAVELGVGTLYLFTPESEAFYARLGWCVRTHLDYHHYPVTIMEKRLG